MCRWLGDAKLDVRSDGHALVEGIGVVGKDHKEFMLCGDGGGVRGGHCSVTRWEGGTGEYEGTGVCAGYWELARGETAEGHGGRLERWKETAEKWTGARVGRGRKSGGGAEDDRRAT